ncbi:hypothetical protein B1694_10820 [Geobacillus zalihae]|nr:hypothetical protein B1694_10820 [Geobacillus zalihae]
MAGERPVRLDDRRAHVARARGGRGVSDRFAAWLMKNGASWLLLVLSALALIAGSMAVWLIHPEHAQREKLS